jgi:biopolymer transport protein ExbB/TolQ
MWCEIAKGIPAAFITLVIGCIAAGIAYRQYKVAHARFMLDLFEKRHGIYLHTGGVSH